MIAGVKLKFGRAPGQPPLEIQATPITVFVGPNNSGKSKVLAEIHQFCVSGQINAQDVLLDSLTFTACDEATAAQRIAKVTLAPNPEETLQPGRVIVGKRGSRIQVQRTNLLQSLTQPTGGHISRLCQWFLVYNTLLLNGQNRISLVNQQPGGDLQQPAHSAFQVLFRDDDKRAEVRRIIYDAFGLYLVVDPTQLGTLRLRLSHRPPAEPIEERGIHEEAVAFHGHALPIEQQSDGVKAFTGMITEIVAGDPSIILIDEPEAFLHPALSFNLGKEVARAAAGAAKRVFASTHSPNFVMGCIQSGAEVNIIRLTYRAGTATARVLRNQDILRLMRNPLLRSSNVLAALFFEFVIVTESDADRAFYQEINERLLRFNDARGIPNCLFLNAQNKQTVQAILKPLRELGIPAAGIVDIDVLKDGGSTWTGFLGSGYIPEIEHQPLGTHRASIKTRLEATGRNMKRDGGINLLAGEDREAASNLLERLGQYGLFVVEHGELESWLNQLGAGGHGPAWLINVFERMGEDPDLNTYVRPQQGDVWNFLNKIKAWLTNPQRRGVPV
jgi:predicted ATPase